MEKIFQYIDEKIVEIKKEVAADVSTLNQKSKDNRSSEIHIILMFLDIYMHDSRTTHEEMDKIFDYTEQLEEYKDYYA